MAIPIEWSCTLGILLLVLVAEITSARFSHRNYYSYRYTEESSDSWVAGAIVGGIFGFIVFITITYICCQAGNCCCKSPKIRHRTRATNPISQIYTDTRDVQSRPGSEVSRVGIQLQTGNLRNNYLDAPPSGSTPVDTPFSSRPQYYNDPPPTIPGYRPQINVIPETSGERVLSPPPPYSDAELLNPGVARNT
ncbi:uncharacterized protein LOC111106527 [Crassostrea virginica]